MMTDSIFCACLRRLLLCFTTILVYSSSAFGQTVPVATIRAAVVAFDDFGTNRNVSRLTTDFVVNALNTQTSWSAESPGEVHAVMAKLQNNTPGEVDLQAVYDLRRKLGVDIVITGAVLDFEDNRTEKHVSLTIKAIDTGTGNVIWCKYASKTSRYREALLSPRKSVNAYSLLNNLCMSLIGSLVGSLDAFQSRQAESPPLSEKLRFRLARLYYLRHQYTEAVSHIEYVVAQFRPADPSVEGWHYMLGETYERLDKWNEALETWNSYQSYFPVSKYSEITFRKGRTLHMLGRYNAAVAILSSLLRTTDGEWSERAMLEMAGVYRDLSEYGLAVQVLEELIDGRRNSVFLDQAYLELGKIHLQSGDFTSALAAGLAFIDLFPDSKEIGMARYICGSSLQQLSFWIESIRQLQSALMYIKDPVLHNEILYRLGLGYQKTGDLPLAAGYADRVKVELLATERAIGIYSLLGWIYFELEDYELALENFALFLQSGSNDAEILYTVGMSYLALDQQAPALNFLQQVIETGDDSMIHNALRQAASILFDKGRVDEAISMYKILGETENPYTFEALLTLAIIYIDLGRLDTAKEYLRRVVTTSTDESERIRAQNWLSTIEYRQRKSEDS